MLLAPMDQPPSSDGVAARLDSTAYLLERVRDGDEAARERLFARFLPVLQSWAHRRLPARARDLSDTDDLVQVTLARALRRIAVFEARREGAFLAYLRTILLNLVREEIRRSARRGNHDELSDDLDDGSASAIEQYLGRERMERYERALGEMPDAMREAVLLRIEFGYSWERIAEALGKPSANAARMAVVRAIEDLARRIDAAG